MSKTKRKSKRKRKLENLDKSLGEKKVTQTELGGVVASSRAARIASVSSGMGFEPSNSVNDYVVSYSKNYGVPGEHSRVARATAQFDKGVAGLEHSQLKGFVVSVTAYLPAEPSVVQKSAPEVMREDLLEYMELLGSLKAPEDQAVLVNIQCDGCARNTPEFYAFRGKRLCGVCFKRKTGSA